MIKQFCELTMKTLTAVCCSSGTNVWISPRSYVVMIKPSSQNQGIFEISSASCKSSISVLEFSKSLYLCNHLSESIHSWTKGTLPYPTLPYPTLPYPTPPHPTPPHPYSYPALFYPSLPYPTLPYPTLPYPTPPLPHPYPYPALPFFTLPYPTLPHL